ncbi:MAG: glycosyltransferase family 2 protein [Bacteroidia bacterium]
MAVSYLLAQIFIAALIHRTKLPPVSLPESSPQVLIPFRNEAAYLEGLIPTLQAQTLKLRLLFGNDSSEDDSTAVIQKMMGPDAPVKLIPPSIHEKYPGKQAVLVCLEEEVESEVFFVADADMRFPPTWAEALYRALVRAPDMGGVCGPSLPIVRTAWDGFQRIEWASVLYLIAASQSMGWIPTAIGNSLALKRVAWASIGGWKSLPPTLVEDYELMEALEKQGWKFRWVFHPKALGETRAEPSMKRWFHQRLRWRWAVQKVPPLHAGYWVLQSLTPWMAITSGSWLAVGWISIMWTISELLPLWRFREVVSTQKILRYLPLLLVYRFIQGVWLLWLSMTDRPVHWRGRWYDKRNYQPSSEASTSMQTEDKSP